MTQWTSELVILTVWKRVRDTYNPSNDRPICTDDIFIIDICVYIYSYYIYLFIHYILYIFQDRHPLWCWMALFQMPIFQGSSWRSWVRGSSRCELLGFAFAGVRICCWEVSLFWCLNHKDTQYIYIYICIWQDKTYSHMHSLVYHETWILIVKYNQTNHHEDTSRILDKTSHCPEYRLVWFSQ